MASNPLASLGVGNWLGGSAAPLAFPNSTVAAPGGASFNPCYSPLAPRFVADFQCADDPTLQWMTNLALVMGGPLGWVVLAAKLAQSDASTPVGAVFSVPRKGGSGWYYSIATLYNSAGMPLGRFNLASPIFELQNISVKDGNLELIQLHTTWGKTITFNALFTPDTVLSLQGPIEYEWSGFGDDAPEFHGKSIAYTFTTAEDPVPTKIFNIKVVATNCAGDKKEKFITLRVVPDVTGP